MLAAEQAGLFQYKDGTSNDFETKSSDPVTDCSQRLQDLSVSGMDMQNILSKFSTSVPEKTTTKSLSSSRPLTVDDDDLDIDLEIDENIDITVSCLHYYYHVNINIIYEFCKLVIKFMH